jgi:phospholipid/cholesterol/gamma-HCH transport system permease protein
MQRWLRRLWSSILLGGQVLVHLLKLRIHYSNTMDQMRVVGPASIMIALLISTTVGMVFTIQVAREFISIGVGRAVGGVLSLALARELAPVLTAVVVSGRVGSAFAAEIGTMKVSEQIDALYILKTDPVDYLVIPRLIACCVMVPILTWMALAAGIAGGWLIATTIFSLSSREFIESCQNILNQWDIISSGIKGLCFGALIAIIGCNWGLTTSGGAKGVGESTTAAVVTSLLAIFVSNFFLSWLMFQGAGTSVGKGI